VLTFSTPLELAPLQHWQALAVGPVLPIRRTDANYTSGGGTVTVPALGVPADGLVQIHGWRESDGSVPLTTLARRLEPTGPVRSPGPMLPAGSHWLSLRASSPGAVELQLALRVRKLEGSRVAGRGNPPRSAPKDTEAAKDGQP
jgi:hypothetical protein